MADTVECPKCRRQSGVRRTACIYCGEPLPVTADSAGVQVPALKPIEEWESGYSVVLAPLDQDTPSARQLTRLAEIAHIEESEARSFLDSRISLPVARVGSAQEAELIATLLGDADLGTTILSDESLALDFVLKRVREIRLGEENIAVQVLWGDWAYLPREDVVLAVEGRVVATQVDIVEGVGKQRRTFDVEEAAQFFIESYAIDVHGPTLGQGFRIKADSFDFGSVLENPSVRLDQNVTELGATLEAYLGASRYDADYSRVVRLLDRAWPQESRVQSHGLRHKADFKKHTSSSVTTDASRQFTRYSRMRYRLRQL